MYLKFRHLVIAWPNVDGSDSNVHSFVLVMPLNSDDSLWYCKLPDYFPTKPEYFNLTNSVISNEIPTFFFGTVICIGVDHHHFVREWVNHG